MNRKVILIIGLQALMIVLMFWMLVFYGKDEYESYKQAEEEEIVSPNRVINHDGISTIEVSLATQQQNDIRTSKLAQVSLQSFGASYGSVVNIDELINLRAKFLAAKANANLAKASIVNSEQEYQRLKALNLDDHNISDRAVAIAEAAFKADQAKISAAETSANGMRDSIRQQWGNALAQFFTDASANKVVADLLAYTEVLIQVTMPAGFTEPKSGSVLTVTPIGTQTKTVQAKFISVSPKVDSTIQGKTYFYLAPAEQLRAGMRLAVEIPNAKTTESGYVVPTSAVVWYGGKAWVYKKQNNTAFFRVPVATNQETKDGWYNENNAELNQEIVINGAQLLLSEEFKFQIKNENED